MKTIIAGSRGITDYEVIKKDIDSIRAIAFKITEIYSGTARGVDRLGERYADENSIPIKRFPADWNTYGKRAGYLRNQEMAETADALIAFWDGESKGTKHMIDIAKSKGLIVYVLPASQSEGLQ